MKVDFLIVGQGLAGTLLAHELYRQQKTFVVFDDPDQPKASEVAAGLINPVVFRRMTKSWMVDDAFPQMELTYRQLEDILQERLYFPSPMMKVFEESGAAFWKEKVRANYLEDYLEVEPDFDLRNKNTKASFGFGQVNKSGRLDLQKLISAFSGFLHRNNLIRIEKLDLEKLTIKSDRVIYSELSVEKIIFCEGPSVSQNPFFKNLIFKHSKGEILELNIPGLNLNEILSHQVFVMPIDEDRYKVGATYSWDELNWETTNTARKELMGKLDKIISVNSEVLNQKAGIRPTMHDRKPVIGILPDQPQIGIFNGLGSKGVLLGPYFAKQLADYLLADSGYIHPEADIKRYFRFK
jgi:glycine/D-amino acid oxidase-like deaminating enzyme